jgi:hypothetical protein
VSGEQPESGDINLSDWVSRSEQAPFALAPPASLAAEIQNQLTSEYNNQALINVQQHLLKIPARTELTAADPSPDIDYRPPNPIATWSMGPTHE